MTITRFRKPLKILLFLILILAIFQLGLFLNASGRFLHRHFLIKEKNLIKIYGQDSWILITGASSGQGKHFAIEMAKKGFNLILIGSIRTKSTIQEIENMIKEKKINSIKIEFIEKDFRKAHESDFFDEIDNKINNVGGNLSGLINNVAYRTAWNPYHESPSQSINDSIIVGTIVQSQLTRIAISYFLKRDEGLSNFIVNITAQCIFPTFGLGEIMDNNITVPYLSVYEAANAFGFYQGNSIYKEYNDKKYKDRIHILNVMPGAVVTENTEYLGGTMFNVTAENFVKNVVKQIGTYKGNTYGYWGHEFSILLVNLCPFIKDSVLKDVGLNISRDVMSKPAKKY
jgi:17beta-estradiol 17-dehydrogenase / very-long-chain 3-oxoacyl-CoA reductase